MLKNCKESLEQIIKMGIREKCKILKEHIVKKFNIHLLGKKIFTSREDAEETLNLFGIITNNIFSTIENEKVAEVDFSELFEEL